MSAPRATLHASAVAIDGRGIVILGRPGAGKSDLALRLIDRGARLIADDAVVVAVDRHRLAVSPLSSATPGRLFAAGIGVVALPSSASAKLALAIDLDTLPATGALPAIRQYFPLDGWAVPLLSLDGTAASAAIKVALALHRWGL